jgi:hypothetical protein
MSMVIVLSGILVTTPMPGTHRKIEKKCVRCGAPFWSRPYQKQSHCSRRCSGAARGQDLAIRFWAKVDKSGDCWLWTGATNNRGYGMLDVVVDGRSRRLLAHRVAWELENGPIPSGRHVCHDCPTGDNPLCVRHLWLGDRASNMRDMAEKDRVSHGRRNPRAVLTPEAVRDMRQRHASGVTQRQLAREFGVTPSAVSRAVGGQNWARVQSP